MTTHRSAYWTAISLIIAVIALTGLGWGTAHAKIYKYRDDQGKLHFTNEKSSIPMKYRSGPQTEELRERFSPPSTSSSPNSSSSGTGGTPGAPAGTEAKPTGLSEAGMKLAKGSIAMFKKGVALAKEYEGAQNSFPKGRKLYGTIKANMTAKKGLIKKLAKSKDPVLASARSLLQKTLANDKATPRPKVVSTRKTRKFIKRVVGEGPAQAAMIAKLEQAIEKAEKAKAEAEKEKGQEPKAGLSADEK